MANFFRTGAGGEDGEAGSFLDAFHIGGKCHVKKRDKLDTRYPPKYYTGNTVWHMRAKRDFLFVERAFTAVLLPSLER